MRVAIIGFGFCGLSAAYGIWKNNYNVDIIDRDTLLWGLASTFKFGGQELERFYHHWLVTDEHIFNFSKNLECEKN